MKLGNHYEKLRDQFACELGRAMLDCGEVEFFVLHWFRCRGQMDATDIAELKNRRAKEKFRKARELCQQLEDGAEDLKLIDRAASLMQRRNEIAHTPVSVDLFESHESSLVTRIGIGPPSNRMYDTEPLRRLSDDAQALAKALAERCRT